MCSDIASHGYVVFAPEHEDGSASYACVAGQPANKPIKYVDDPKDLITAERNQGLIDYRAPFFDKRSKELGTILTWLQAQSLKAKESAEPFTSILKSLFQRMDLDRVHLGGHSFGSATVASVLSSPTQDLFSDKVSSCFLLDIWAAPLADTVVESGLQKPCLSILTEHFKGEWHAETCQSLLQNSANVQSFYLPGTKHQQFSDSVFWGTEAFARKTGSMGDTNASASQSTLISAVISFLNDPDEPVAHHDVLLPF